MSTERIGPDVIDAALDAWFICRGVTASIKGQAEDDAMEAAIRAADEKRGLRVETIKADPHSLTQFAPQWRYVSDWQPVEESS